MPLKLASFTLGKTLLPKILNVSERPRTGVVPSNSDILALPKFPFKN